ncbi:MAG: alpha/beta fold hydrolase [Bacilli bacterium]|nr:alpha/beta fold hydrolase [Bacilli bacterium]
MKKENNQKKLWGIIGLVAVVVIFVGVVLFINPKDKDTKKTTEEYEAQQYRMFTQEVSDYVASYDTSANYDTAKSDLIAQITQSQKKYEDGAGVSSAANQLVNNITSSVSGTTEGLLDGLTSIIGGLGDTIMGNADPTNTLSLRSTTACDDGDIDAKYCVDGLSAKIYVTNPNSNKWAVLVHGFMMSGKAMHTAVGSMYEAQDYNVMAVDLRGFGDSDGSVAMGYLESLDTYDWIKDLNANWQSRYGVNVAPQTIVVHGISLGGATTLQLATNPDIAAANGTAPYTKNLTQLNVKGFVDDCGYTSMSGIITGMLSGGSTDQLSSLLGSLDISKIDFMSELQKVASSLNLDALTNIDISGIIGGKGTTDDYLNYFEQFSGKFNETIANAAQSNNWQTTVPEVSQSGNDWQSLYENWQSQVGSGQYQIPGVDSSTVTDWFNNATKKQTSTTSNAKVTLVENSLGIDLTGLLDTLVETVIMDLVGVGLNDNNYDKYSNVFSEGRRFPANSNVVIIHGTADTTVPHSNADTVAEHINNTKDANLLYKWDVSGGAHATIVVGMNKTQYTNLIGNFTNCVANNQCSNFNSSDSSAPLNSIAK